MAGDENIPLLVRDEAALRAGEELSEPSDTGFGVESIALFFEFGSDLSAIDVAHQLRHDGV